jgi:hypothetical protein
MPFRFGRTGCCRHVNFRRATLARDAIQGRANHVKDMTTYTILPHGDGSSFNISVVGSNGARQTMLGFASEAEAQAWIDRDKRLSGVTLMPVVGAVADRPTATGGQIAPA